MLLPEFDYRFSDDINTLHYLLFGDDQWRRQSDDIAVGRLGEQAVLFQRQT